MLGIGLLAIGPAQPVPLGALGLMVLLPALAALPLLAIHLWLATARGFALTFALGSMAGLFGARSPLWPVVPWAWPTRVATFVAEPDGGPPGVAGAGLVTLGLALAVAVGVGAASARWFARADVR